MTTKVREVARCRGLVNERRDEVAIYRRLYMKNFELTYEALYAYNDAVMHLNAAIEILFMAMERPEPTFWKRLFGR